MSQNSLASYVWVEAHGLSSVLRAKTVMLVYENVLFYFLGVGLFFGFAFPQEVPVKCKSSGYQQLGEVIYNYYCNESRWDEAKTYCSKRGETLLDFTDSEDLQYVKNLNASLPRIWIGLKKNKSDLNENVRNVEELFKIKLCEITKDDGPVSDRNAYNLLPSVCVKSLQDQCDVHWQKHGRQCFLPVYDRMSCFGALAHCKRLNGMLNAGNFAKALIFNASQNIGTPFFWTGKLKEIHIDPHAMWTWGDGSLFGEWNERKIIITDVGCNGCGFMKNGTIYLTSKCSQRISYLCEKDRKDHITSSFLNHRQLSWRFAKRNCSLLQLSKNVKDVTDVLPSGDTIIQENMPYWLGIHKNNTCKTHIVEDLANVTSKPTRCLYVENSYGNGRWESCDEKNHFICVKPEVICGSGWLVFNESCYRIEQSHELNWNDARRTCNEFGDYLLKIDDLSEQTIIINEIKRHYSSKYWIGFRHEKVKPLWQWIVDNTTAGFTNWIRGEPNASGKDKCVLILKSLMSHSVTWNAANCSRKFGFICERTDAATCDEDWKMKHNSCYKIEKTPSKSWHNALVACLDLDATLLKIDNLQEQKNVNDLLGRSEFSHLDQFWIGLRDTQEYGKWQWISDNSSAYYKNWSNGEPNVRGAKSCVYINASLGHWNHHNCSVPFKYICERRDLSPVCPNNWNHTHNGLCWRAFDNLQMTWKAAHSFCLQHDSRLANLTDVQVINKTATDGRRYWINNAEIKVYPPQDPLQGWYWLDGRQFNASHRRGLYGRLERYTGPNERCATIHESKSVSWKDMPCNKRCSFVCKKKKRIKSTSGSDMDSKEVEAKIMAIISRRFHKGRINKRANMELLQLAKNKSFRGSFKTTTGDGTIVDVLTSSLDHLSRIKGSLPIKSLLKLCRKQPNCTVKRVTVHLKDVDVNISHLSNLSPLVPSDIITLDYIVNEELISKLEGNETISLNFSKKLTSITKNQVNCLFLDGDKWNTTGMTVGSIDGENIECLTNHLSSFTMVVLDAEVSQSNKVALNYVSYFGSALSLACLLFTCIIYIVLYKDLQILTTSRHLVHFNLQIALGLTQIVFLAGGNATQNETACKVVAISVHYFSLAGFTWILLEAVMLYLKLISVYGGEFVRMKNFLLFGWGFPLLLVGLSAGVKIDGYGTDQWCWLSYEDGFVWVFFAPVIIITSVTLVVVIVVIRVLFIASKSEDAGAKKNIISAARCIIILFPTLGLSWGFSIIAVNHDALIWKYLFAIFTSLQGFFIFLIYGVCNAEIRGAVSRKIGYDVHPSTSMT